MADEARDESAQSVALVPIKVVPQTSILPSRDELSVILAIAGEVSLGKTVLPKDMTKPEAFAVMLAGREIGVPPMTALRHIFVVNGKTDLDGQLMQGIVLANDTSAEFVIHESTGLKVDIELKRQGRPPFRVEYTIDDAKKAGLAEKGPWKAFPRDMLFWHTMKRVCRRGAPDLINAVEGSSAKQAALVADMTPQLELSGEAVDVTDKALYSEGDGPEKPASGPEAAETGFHETERGADGVYREIPDEPIAETPIAQEPVAEEPLPAPPVVATMASLVAWLKGEGVNFGEKPRRGVCIYLGITDDCEDPLVRHWIDKAGGAGISKDVAFAMAQSCVMACVTEARNAKAAGSPKPTGDAIAAVGPQRQLQEAIDNANNKAADAAQAAAEDTGGDDPAPAAEGGN